ncbi:MAG: hypothetical protein JNL98_25955 [Bryobacterales bacterium]|nr:hypothetical protein [Bryobacterales bacterium]
MPVLLILIGASLGVLPAQTPLSVTGLVNAASGVPSSLAGNSAAPHSLSYVEGAGFTASARAQLTSSRSGRRFDLPILQRESSRLLVQIPAIEPGPARLAVTQATQSTLPASILPADPGLFSRNGKGWGPARATVLSPSGRHETGPSRPVRPGDLVWLAATGLGRAPAKQVTIVTGGVTATAEFIQTGSGQQPDQIRYRIPAAAPGGCFVPVFLRVGNVTSNSVSLSLDRDGKPCRAPEYFPFANWFGGRSAFAVLARTIRDGNTVDEALASFLDLRGVAEPSGPLVYIPPPGLCGTSRAAIGPETAMSASFTNLLLSQLQGKGLNAGRRVTLAVDGNLRAAPPRIGAPGVYVGTLGSDPPEAGRRARPLFYRPGEVRIAAEGGADVPAFAALANSPATFSIPNSASLKQISPNRDLTVTWQGLDAKYIVLTLVLNTSHKASAGGLCYCTAQASAGRITVPAYQLQSLPPGSGAEVIVIAIPASATATVPGFPHSLIFGASIRVVAAEVLASGL